jgi:cation/acetate symporter
MNPDGEPKSDFIQNAGKLFAIYIFGTLAVVTLLSIVQRLGAAAHHVTFTIVGLAAVIFLAIGLLSRTSSARHYFKAGSEVPPFYSGMASAAAWLPATLVLGVTGSLYALGFDGLAYLVGLLAGTVVMCILLAPYLNRSGASTLPGFFGARYGRAAQALSAVLLIVVCFLLAVAQVNAIGGMSERLFGVGYEMAVWGILVFIVVMIIAGGMRSVTWTQAVQYVLIASALFTPITLLSMTHFGWPIGPVAMGHALDGISNLEIDMIEKGFADAGTLKPHVAPFLQIDKANFLALVLCLMMGTASLPHLLSHSFTVAGGGGARLSSAWCAFFALLLAVSLPAYAAFAKFEIYSVVDRGTAVSELPAWFEEASNGGLVKIYGVSADALTDAIRAVGEGAEGAAGIEDKLQSAQGRRRSAFLEQDETVRAAIAETAKSLVNASQSAIWDAFCKKILPVAAQAAGNAQGMLTEEAIKFHPYGVLVLAAGFLASSPIALGVLIAGLLAVCLAATSGLLFSIAAALGHDLYFGFLDHNAPELRRIATTAVSLILVAAAVGYAAVKYSGIFVTVALSAFSLAASAFFPAMVLGILWKRANAWGAVAGILAGFGVCLYYVLGTQYAPVSFFETWSMLSVASEDSLETLKLMTSDWAQATGEAKSAAEVALTKFARGGLYHTGLANWFGVPAIASAVFAVPLGFLTAALVSLLTPRPNAQFEAFVERIRRP